MSSVGAVRARLWAALKESPEHLARASAAYLGRLPEEDDWPELLDFTATEWLDDDGRTLAERLEPACATWPSEVRTSLWVVDGHGVDTVRLRDLADDSELDVACPATAHAELPRKTVLRARLVPWAGQRVFFGEPASYGTQGVLARLSLLDAWRQGPEPDCLAGLRARRLAFARQRRQHRLWRQTFGADLVRFPDADTMEAALAALLERVHAEGPPRPVAPPVPGALPPPTRVELRVADALRGVPPAAWFHEDHGVAFLAAADAPAEADADKHPLWSRPAEPAPLPELGDPE